MFWRNLFLFDLSGEWSDTSRMETMSTKIKVYSKTIILAHLILLTKKKKKKKKEIVFMVIYGSLTRILQAHKLSKYMYEVPSISFQTLLYRHLKLS